MADKDDGPGHAEVRVSSFAFARVRAVACARTVGGAPRDAGRAPSERDEGRASRVCARARVRGD